MPPTRVIEPIDVLEYRPFRLASGFPSAAPDQLGLDGFEERLDHGIVVTVSLPAHRDQKSVFDQAFLVFV